MTHKIPQKIRIDTHKKKIDKPKSVTEYPSSFYYDKKIFARLPHLSQELCSKFF